MSDTTDQIYDEIHAIIRRYQAEGETSGFLIIGCLEAVKADVLYMLAKDHEK